MSVFLRRSSLGLCLQMLMEHLIRTIRVFRPYLTIFVKRSHKGAFNNFVDRILPFFTPPPCVDSFYTLSVDKNRHLLPPPPPPPPLILST